MLKPIPVLARRVFGVAFGIACIVLSSAIISEAWSYAGRARSLFDAQRQLEDTQAHDLEAIRLLDESLYTVIRASNKRPSQAAAILLVFDSVACTACRDAHEGWISLAQRTYDGKEVEVWIVVPSASDLSSLPDRLLEREISFQIMAPSVPPSFGVRTGVRLMPTGLMVLDRANVTCVFNGTPSQNAVAICQDRLAKSPSFTQTFIGASAELFVKPATFR